jgi:hypothetical protein
MNSSDQLGLLTKQVKAFCCGHWIPGSDSAIDSYNRLICGNESDLWRPHLYPVEVRARHVCSKKQRLLIWISASGVKAARMMADRAYYEILDMIQPNQLALALTPFDPDKSIRMDWIVITI